MSSHEFDALKARWYALLAADGFQDAENPDGTMRDRGSAEWAAGLAPVVAAARREYYNAAGAYLHENEWDDVREFRIWQMHADGCTVRAIAKVVGISYPSVWRIVARHRQAMRGTNRAIETVPEAGS